MCVCVSNYVKLMFGPQRCLFGVDKEMVIYRAQKGCFFVSQDADKMFPAEGLNRSGEAHWVSKAETGAIMVRATQ